MTGRWAPIVCEPGAAGGGATSAEGIHHGSWGTPMTGCGEVSQRPADRLDDVAATVEFLMAVDDLKQVRRQNPIATGRRRERTAEHCWHVAIAALCLHEWAAEEIDLDRALRLAIIHDLPEAAVGDTFVYGPGVSHRFEREQAGLRRLLAGLPTEAANRVHEAWHEYELETSAEGRYIMALDIMLPIFLNFRAGVHSSWRRHNVAAAAVRSRVERVRRTIPALAGLAMQTIDEAVARGLLAGDGSA